MVDEAGDYDVGGNEEQAAERFAENIGGEIGTGGIRRVKLTVKVPLPAVIELSGEVTIDESAAALTVAH